MTGTEIELIDDSGEDFPWSPQPGETAIAYASFNAYRSQGPKRSIAATARETGRDASTLRALSSRFSWVERAVAFDAYLENREIEELAQGRVAMRKAHVNLAEIAREKILARLESLDPGEMTVRDLAVWLDLSVKIERQARGEADRTIRVEGEINVAGMNAEQRRQLMAEALEVLNHRLGVTEHNREVTAYLDGEVVEDE